MKSGTGVLTLSAAAAATLTIDSTTRLDGAGAAANQVLKWDGTAYSPASLVNTDLSNWNEAVDDRVAALLVAGSGIGLSYNDAANTLTISATGGITGSGTADQIAYWTAANTLASDTNLRWNGTRMAVGAPINAAYRLLSRGTGTGASTYGLVVQDSAGNNTMYVRDDGRGFFKEILWADRLSTVTGVSWDLRTFTAASDAASIGYVECEVGGVVRKFMIRA